MRNELTAVAYDLDHESAISLRDALPGWEIQIIDGETLRPTERDRIPGAAGLVVLGANASLSETLGLCRALRNRVDCRAVPFLALVPPHQEAQVRAILEAGADNCLVLPVHPKEIMEMVSHKKGSCPGRADHPGRHTLNLDQPRHADENRDDGGEG